MELWVDFRFLSKISMFDLSFWTLFRYFGGLNFHSLQKRIFESDEGNSVSGGRIVGGDDAVAHSWPWIVRVRLGWSSCGGTILNDNHVMCAAHCCDGKDASSTTITIGEHHTATDRNRITPFFRTHVTFVYDLADCT